MRESNFELLRIISMLMIVFLHLGTHGLQKNIDMDGIHGIELYVYYFLRSLSIIAVNLYVLISGYFLINKKKNEIKKIILFVAEIGLFGAIIYFVYLTSNSMNFDLIKFIEYVFGALTNKYWFVTVYLVLFLLHPYINIIVRNIDKKQYLKLLVTLFFICSLWQFYYNFKLTGVSSGYGILSFIFLYLLGGYIRLYGFIWKELKNKYNLINYLLISFINAFLMYIFATKGFDEGMLLKYCSPLVVISSYFLFVYFKNLKIKSKFINNLSTYSFGIYLVHEQPEVRYFIWNKLETINYIVNSSNPFNTMIKMFIITLLVFVISLIVSILITKIFNYIVALFEYVSEKLKK